jgi:5-methyltetrahydrofolate--homocysteine methyltransferase
MDETTSLLAPSRWEDFDAPRWAAVRRRAEAWWDGTLPGPLLRMTLHGAEPDPPPPAVPYHGHAARYGSQTPPEQIAEACAHHLAGQRFLGDGFPLVRITLSPVCAAAFLGAEISVARGEGAVWVHAAEERDPGELRLCYDPENPYLVRTRQLLRAGVERFGSKVLVPLPTLGHNMDLLAPFRSNEALLLDLYDRPGEVERLVWEIHEAWFAIVADLDAALGRPEPGYAAWNQLYSAEPVYILQCDFGAMVGPEMFARFALPEIVASARRLGRAMFHLDGPGMLPHLDHILAVPEIAGVQWVPGPQGVDIARDAAIYRRIHEAGKRIELIGGARPEQFEALADLLGTAKGIYYNCAMPIEEADAARKLFERYMDG